MLIGEVPARVQKSTPIMAPSNSISVIQKEAEPAEQGGDIYDGLGIGGSIFTPLVELIISFASAV